MERDYAISILRDVTGSMNSDKVREAFKALVTVAEPLARLGVKMEVIGFNSELYIYKRFNEKLSEEARARIGTLPDETQGSAASYTDDGWALNVASARLGKVEAKKKFIIICTDGESNLSPAHSQPENEVDEAIRRIREQTDQVVIGLGIGHGTEFVSRVYPNNLANIDVHELPKKLAQLLEEIVKNHGQFRR